MDSRDEGHPHVPNLGSAARDYLGQWCLFLPTLFENTEGDLEIQLAREIHFNISSYV